MIRFSRIHLLAAGILAIVSMHVEMASGQFAPRRFFGGGWGYPGYDFAFNPEINQSIAQLQQANTQEREYQAQTAMAQTAAWQNINQTMQQQANQQTQSMLAQRQSAQNWWYQVQTQQWANRQAREASQAVERAKSDLEDSYKTSDSRSSASKSSANEIMVWPTLLRNSAFTQLRSEVEAPFRRAYADGKPITANDYQGILQAIDEMKTKLKDFASQVVASEYAAVEDYLNELSADAQKRLEARLPPKPAVDKVEGP